MYQNICIVLQSLCLVKQTICNDTKIEQQQYNPPIEKLYNTPLQQQLWRPKNEWVEVCSVFVRYTKSS